MLDKIKGLLEALDGDGAATPYYLRSEITGQVTSSWLRVAELALFNKAAASSACRNRPNEINSHRLK